MIGEGAGRRDRGAVGGTVGGVRRLTMKLERRNQSSGLPETPPRNRSIVEGAGAQFAIRQGEGARRRRRPVDRVHHQNAVAGRHGPRSADIGDVHRCVAGRGGSPLMTNLSEGEPSPPRNVLMAIEPPAPT